jgi:glutamyl-tRNA synthetase/glutamyl-Q tRNA(Asp) synthetase
MQSVRLDRIAPGATTRFAPSPTGVLHLGHVVNAVWTWGIARAVGGRVLLRLEDHDRGRCRPASEASILEDLEWLGLEPDPRPGERLFRQSDHDHRYRSAVDRLAAAGRVYPCRCSRQDIVRALGVAAPGRFEELRYPGTCRDLGLEPLPGRGLRVVLPGDSIPFEDLRLGPRADTPAEQCGDLLLRNPQGQWTYQLSVTVDDLEDGVDLVVRGEDLVDSTARQILLARLLGRERPPRFVHHPLILDGARKLSKRDGDLGLAVLRAAGWSRERVLGEAARLSGLPAAGPVGPGELGGLFLR